MKCNHIKVKSWHCNGYAIWGYCKCGKSQKTVSPEVCERLIEAGEKKRLESIKKALEI